MIAASLFSGIGAPEQSMPHWQWPWHAEIDRFPSAVMKIRHPHSTNLGDVSDENFCEKARSIGRPDVLVFGSPCQSFSVAGGRLGLDDPRGNMALVGLAVVAELRPRWVVFENVPGLFSSYSGSDETESAVREGRAAGAMECDEDSDFAALLSAFRQCGYLGCYRVLDAQYAGVPQRRRRIIFVGYIGDWRPPAAVLLEPESLQRRDPPRRQTGQAVAGTLSVRSSSGGGFGTDFDVADGLVAGAVSSKWSKGTGGPAGDECYNLVPAPTISGNMGVRRLTPLEVERLQGFPTDYTAIPYRGGMASDTPRYKALGNSMAIPVIGGVLRRIEAVDAVLQNLGGL